MVKREERINILHVGRSNSWWLSLSFPEQSFQLSVSVLLGDRMSLEKAKISRYKTNRNAF
jgi:hypothetical protein